SSRSSVRSSAGSVGSSHVPSPGAAWAAGVIIPPATISAKADMAILAVGPRCCFTLTLQVLGFNERGTGARTSRRCRGLLPVSVAESFSWLGPLLEGAERDGERAGVVTRHGARGCFKQEVRAEGDGATR